MGSIFGTGPLDQPPFILPEEEPQPAPPQTEPQKTQTYASRFFNYVADSLSWSAAKIVEAIAITPGSIAQANNKSLAYLEALTGDEQFGDVVDSLSPLVSNLIADKLLDDGVIKSIIQSDKPFVTRLSRSLINEAAANIAVKLSDEGKPISAVTIIIALFNALNDSVKDLLSSDKLLDEPLDPSVGEIAKNSASKLLNVIFPYGGYELPLNYGINGLVWNKLKNSLIPDALISYARAVKPLLIVSQFQNLEHLPHGALAKRWIGQAVSFAEQEGKALLKDPKTAANLARKLVLLLPQDVKEDMQSRTPWLTDMFKQLGNADAESVSALWAFVNSGTESAVSFIIFHISRTLDPEDKGIDVAGKNLLKLIDSEMAPRHRLIRETYQQMIQANRIPENEPAYLRLFRPFVAKLIELSGIKEVISKLPDAVQGDIETLLAHTIGTLIAKHYQSDVPELAIGYASMVGQLGGISRMEELQQEPSSDLSLKLVEGTTASLTKLASGILTDDELRESISERLAALPKTLSPETKQMLTDALVSFLSGEDPQDAKMIEGVITLFRNSIEALASHTLYNLNRTLDPDNKGGGAAIRRLLELIKDTYMEQHPLIQETYRKLLDQNVVPETSDEYIQQFYPMVARLEEISGISSLLELFPIRHRLKLDAIIHKLLGEFLAKNYQTEIAPLVNYLLNIPLQTKEPEELNPFTDKLAEFAEEQKPALAKTIAKALVKKLPELENRLDTILRSELSGKKAGVAPEPEPAREGPSQDVIPPGYEELAAWMESWTLSQLTALESSNDPIIANIWQTINLMIDDILGFLLVGKGAASTNLPLNIKLSDYADVIIQFIEKSGDTLLQHYLTLLSEGKVPEETEEFVDRFLPLCKTLTEKLMLSEENSPLPKFIREAAAKYFNREVPLLLAKQYKQTIAPFAAMQQNREQLISLLGYKDEDKIPEGVAQLENILEIVADKIIGSVEASLFEIVEKRIGFNLGLLSLPKVKQLRDVYVKKVVKAFLMELFVNYIKNVDANGQPVRELPLSDILKNLALLLQKHLSENPAAFFEAASIPDENQRKEALRKAFAPMAKELIDQFRSPEAAAVQEPPVTLPFAYAIKGLWNDVEIEILPDVLASMFLDTTSLTVKKEELQQEIEEISGTSHIPEACRVIGHWVADFLPPFLFRERKDVVQTLYEAVSKVISKTGHANAEQVTAYLLEHGEEFKERICEDLFSFFPPDGEVAKIGGPLTKEYIETLMLKALKAVAEKVQQKEEAQAKQGDFLLSIAIRLMTIIHTHFASLNRVATQKGVSTFTVEHQDYLDALGSTLHHGVPHSEAAEMANRTIRECRKILKDNRERLETLTDPAKRAKCEDAIKDAHERLSKAKEVLNLERLPYFTEFSKTILDLTGIKGPDDLPFPSPLKEELWALFEQDLLPMVFRELLGSMLEPKNINAMIIAGLEIFDEALDRVPDPEEQPYQPPQDEKQRELNRVCGSLILALANIMPQSIIKTMFKINKFKAMSAEVIGATVRQVLCEKWTLMTLINTGIASGLSSLHPGEWKEVDGKMTFVGAGEFGEIKFTSPLTAEEVEQSERAGMKQQVRSRAEMKQLMVRTSHKLIKQTIEGLFKWPFIKLHAIWRKCVNKVFGKHADAVRQYFHWLGTKALFRGIQAVAKIIGASFEKVFWFFADLYLSYRAEQVIRNLELDIHESLLYKLVDALTDALKADGTGFIETEAIQEILSEAERLEAEDLVRVGRYLERFGRYQEEEAAKATDEEMPDSSLQQE